MIHLIDKINGWTQNGPMGNDLMKKLVFTALGDYKGEDYLKGWDEAAGHAGKMRRSGEKAIASWQGNQGWDTYGADPYGLGEKLQAYGGDVATYGFDPTSFESIGEGLMRQAFYEDVEVGITQAPEEGGGDVWEHSDERIVADTGNYAKKIKIDIMF